MARLSTYPQSEAINLEDFFVIDGPQGTRCVPINAVMNYIPSNYVTDAVLDGKIGDDNSVNDIDFAPYFLRDANVIPILTPVDGEKEVLGKRVSELQNGVSFSTHTVSGTLSYVEGYEEFSSVTEEQEGNYLAIQFSLASEDEEVEISIRYSNSPRDTVKLDTDKIAVIRVTNAGGDKGTLTVMSKKKTDEYTTRYDLNGLTLVGKVQEVD